MALTATMYRFRVDLSDVDRGVYEQLDLRAARHPSETLRYLVTRVLAYALSHQDGIAFTRGLFEADEPALWVRQPDGRVDHWIEVGRPAVDRLHKASQRAARVSVFTHEPPELLRREASGARVHRGNTIALWTLPLPVVTALEGAVDRSTAFTLVRNEEQLYLTLGGRTHEGTVTRAALVDPKA